MSIQISKVLRTLGRAIRDMEEPAVEKINDESEEDAFQVLISTMLSAQTRDPVTAAASERLFRVASTPRMLAALPRARIQKLIYPVSFYRVKSRTVKETSKQIVERFGGHAHRVCCYFPGYPIIDERIAELVTALRRA